MNESNTDLRQSMLSVPARWSELYFDIFFVLCVLGAAFVVCYEIIRRPSDADAPDVAAAIIVRMAAVPIVSALQAYIIMRARDAIMKTWETYRLERYNKGREDGREEGRAEGKEEGREEGIEIGAQTAIREIRERLAERAAANGGELDDWLDELLSELSENGDGESRRRRDENGAR